MRSTSRSSRQRYRKYRAELKERARRAKAAREGQETPEQAPAEEFDHRGRRIGHRPRARSFFELLRQFWGFLRGHRRILILALVALSFSTLLGLAPLYGTKIVFDSVLREEPLPTGLPL